jgi:Cu-processing system permease protein
MELIVAGLLASASFFTIYAAMLTSALFVRSSALGATVGGALLVLGVIAGYRNELGELFKPGIPQALFYYLTAPLPRFSQLGDIAADIVQARPVDYQMVLRLLLGQAAFGGAWFAVGVWRFEKRDF